MRHADLLREATAVILQCGTWCRCVVAWPCGCVFGGGMNDAIGKNKRVIRFRLSFSTGWRRIQPKKSRIFRLNSPVGILSRKKVEKGRFQPTNPTVLDKWSYTGSYRGQVKYFIV